jgi:UDP-glucose 4-epimerase
MRYLITGGAGFIGSHLTDALIDRGDSVVILDNFSTGSARNIAHLVDDPRVSIHGGSILDEHLVHELVGRSDVVVHLAAAVGVKLIIAEPLESLITNIRGTETVLSAIADRSRKLLVASTSEIYGKNATGPLHEDADRILGSPFKSRWSYSTAKAVDEILTHAYWREKGIPATVVRLFNCVGPRQTGAYGMVVPRFVRQALSGEALSVYGNGEQQRCFCHVDDTVRALMMLLDSDEVVGSVFNVGNQEEVSMNELARHIIDLSHSRSTIEHIPYDVAYEEGFEDMERRVPDITRIGSAVGWKPEHSLERTIADVIDYERTVLSSGDDG